MKILYVYAIGESLGPDAVPRGAEDVDGGSEFSVVSAGGLDAFCSAVDGQRFSQQEIDRRSADLAWIGAIGFRHQNVIGALAKKTTVIPLRAFTMFNHADSLRDYLGRENGSLRKILERIRNKDEWTLRLEFDHEQWSDALVRRVPSLGRLSEEARQAGEGRGYLLRRKMEEERKKAAKSAEEDLLGEVERSLAGHFPGPMIVENRERRSGSFPQITLLIDRKRAKELKKAHEEMAARYARDGVRLVLTGPWPPYSFASEEAHG